MNRILRVAIVGCGVGALHAAIFHELADLYEIVAVCDVDLIRAQALAEKLGVPYVTAEFSEILKYEAVDVIDLCTPSYLHVDQTLQSLETGKDIILEKPVAGSLRDVDRLIAAQDDSRRTIMPIFQNRFGAGIQKLRYLVDSGLTGEALLTTVETAWRRRPEYYATWHGRWETELGGSLVTLGIHAHDVLYSVLGPAKYVSAHLATRVNPIETEDCAAIALQMADGSLATLAVTTGSARQITRHRFCFRDLTAESNEMPYGNTQDPWTFIGDDPQIDQKVKTALEEFIPPATGLKAQFLGFHQAVVSGGSPPLTLQEARQSIELLTAIYASARTKQAVVLPIGEEHPDYDGWQSIAKRF